MLSDMHFCKLRKNSADVKSRLLKQTLSYWFPMKIVGFPVDVSRSQDERIVRGQRIRQSLIQATLDLIQAGDVEPTSGAIATIAGHSEPDALPALHQSFRPLCRGLRSRRQPRLLARPAGRQCGAARQPHRASGFGSRATFRGMAAGLALRRADPPRRAVRGRSAFPICACFCASGLPYGSRPNSTPSIRRRAITRSIRSIAHSASTAG